MSSNRWVLSVVGSLAMLAAWTGGAGCAGNTGSRRFPFEAHIGGANTEGSPTFVNERGWSVTLTKADVTLGPIYLNSVAPLADGPQGLLDRLVPKAYAHGDDHLGGGRVVGEVLGQVKFDALSPSLVSFPALGTVTEEPVRTTDLWFYPGPGVAPDTTKIDTVAVDVEGEATQGTSRVRFRGALVLNDAWLPDATAGSRSAASIASIRRVRGIPADFLPTEGGALEIRMDIKALFRGADFSNLESSPADRDGAKLLVQSKTGKATTDQVMTNLYQGLRSSTGTYAIRWIPKNP